MRCISCLSQLLQTHERPRIVIAGVSSGVGKTTVATGLMNALKRSGLKVQAFKVGPDYIDPSYHNQATNRYSRNLDSYMLDDSTILESFLKATRDADISVIEGVMGLFDGMSGVDNTGSTAQVANLLGAPVLLVVDAWNASRSVAASVLGFALFDPKVKVGGVVLNKVSGETHAKWCTEAITKATGVPVVGWLPKQAELEMPERHLGLIPYGESQTKMEQIVEKIGKFVGNHIDIEKVKELALSAPPINFDSLGHFGKTGNKDVMKIRLGLALDEAFCFYYADALDLLRESGAEILSFSPLRDSSLVDELDGIYIGGGFPEVFAKQLEKNESMRKSIKRAIEDGMPTFAECGGLMYLTNSITDFNGSSSQMVGALDTDTVMTKKLTLSYTLANVIQDTILSKVGDSVRGHEYHYSKLESLPRDANFAYKMEHGVGVANGSDGLKVYNTLACYSHTHLCSQRRMASNFLSACEKYSRR
jgi:cobyrinic acid a,c-diamide synthase